MFGFAFGHHTSGVEAVSCPPSGGEDMLSSSYSGGLAFGPPTHATSGVEAVSCPSSGGEDMLPSSYSGVLAFGPPTHATSVEAVSCPPAGEADTLPPALKSCSVKLLLLIKILIHQLIRVTGEHSGVLAFGPPARYTSGVEAVSCPPSGGEDMLPSSYSGVSAFGPPTHATSGVEAVSCPPAGEADTMPPTLKRCSVKLLLFNKEFCAHSCGSSLVHICAHSWLLPSDIIPLWRQCLALPRGRQTRCPQLSRVVV